MAIDYPWTEPPAHGTAIEAAPGVAWLRMPLPFQLNHINLWLLEDGPGWAIVDTGVGLPDVRALWEQVFSGALGGRPVTQVIVTHFHPDHMGNTGWLTERFAVDLWCPQAGILIRQMAHRTGELGELHPAGALPAQRHRRQIARRAWRSLHPAGADASADVPAGGGR
jgi:glyoxylase-like metal-dependent hydrolase (beta-lactamase superfamily II)